MISDFPNMSTQNLVDLLAQHTIKITHFMAEKNFGRAYAACKEIIEELIVEIEFRKSLFFIDRADGPNKVWD